MPPKRQPRSRPRLPLPLSSQELHPLRPSFFSLLVQLECDRHDHLDGNRLIVQICRFILPISQRIQRSQVQERGSRDHLHVNNISLFIQNCVDLHLALDACLPGDYRVHRECLHERFRRPYPPTYTHGCARFPRWWSNRPCSRIHDPTEHPAKHSTHLSAGHSTWHTACHSAETVGLQRRFLNLCDLPRNHRRCKELSATHEHMSRCLGLDHTGGCGRRRWRGRRRDEQRRG